MTLQVNPTQLYKKTFFRFWKTTFQEFVSNHPQKLNSSTSPLCIWSSGSKFDFAKIVTFDLKLAEVSLKLLEIFELFFLN